MKKKILLSAAILFSINCSIVFCIINEDRFGTHSEFVLDSGAFGYFTLSVGNVYKYHYAASSGFNYDYKVKILKDTIINSRKYFVIGKYWKHHSLRFNNGEHLYKSKHRLLFL